MAQLLSKTKQTNGLLIGSFSVEDSQNRIPVLISGINSASIAEPKLSDN